MAQLRGSREQQVSDGIDRSFTIRSDKTNGRFGTLEHPRAS